MNKKRRSILFILLTVVLIIITKVSWQYLSNFVQKQKPVTPLLQQGKARPPLQDLTIEAIRQRSFPGGNIKIEEDLSSQDGFRSYIISYPSERLKLYALMNIPNTPKPKRGYPVIIINHGYIPPDKYSTINSYKEFSDFYAKNGFLVFKPDYRGYGKSEGTTESGYFPVAYTYDVLNLISSIKNYKEADANNIGLWGHSLGGNVTLRAAVSVSKDIKASVIVAGGGASANDILNYWKTKKYKSLSWIKDSGAYKLIEELNNPSVTSEFLDKISPINYVSNITGRVSLHHGAKDESIPISFSDTLYKALKKVGNNVEYYVYEQGDHQFGGKEKEMLL